MLLNDAEGLTTFEEWQKFFAKLPPLDAAAAWLEGARLSFGQNVSFHFAAIDRQFEIAFLAVAATPGQRSAALEFSTKQIDVLHAQFAHKPDAIIKYDAAIANSRAYHERWGTPTLRAYMFESGQVDEWGASPSKGKDK